MPPKTRKIRWSQKQSCQNKIVVFFKMFCPCVLFCFVYGSPFLPWIKKINKNELTFSQFSVSQFRLFCFFFFFFLVAITFFILWLKLKNKNARCRLRFLSVYQKRNFLAILSLNLAILIFLWILSSYLATDFLSLSCNFFCLATFFVFWIYISQFRFFSLNSEFISHNSDFPSELWVYM